MKKILALIIIVLTPLLLSAQIKSFYVSGEDGRDLVKFTSEAPIETIEGKTSMIKGYLKLSPDDISSTEAKLVVDLVSLKTGIGLRDKHMRENHLETGKYPEAGFTITEVICDNTDISNGEISEILLNGDFTCHGITRPIEVKASVQYFNSQNTCPIDLPGESLHVKAFFEIYLADHEIKRPKFLILKLDEKQVIELDFWASTELPEVNFGED